MSDAAVTIRRAKMTAIKNTGAVIAIFTIAIGLAASGMDVHFQNVCKSFMASSITQSVVFAAFLCLLIVSVFKSGGNIRLLLSDMIIPASAFAIVKIAGSSVEQSPLVTSANSQIGNGVSYMTQNLGMTFAPMSLDISILAGLMVVLLAGYTVKLFRS